MVIHIQQAANLRVDQLDELGPVKKPISEPASRLIGRKYLHESNGVDCMGIWQCSPGRWQRTIMQEEFAHFLSGSATFIPESGEPIAIKGGDTVWFPLNSRGVWVIHETVRKVYVVIDRPSAMRRFRAWMRGLLDPHGAKGVTIPAVVTPVGVQILADTVADGRLI